MKFVLSLIFFGFGFYSMFNPSINFWVASGSIFIGTLLLPKPTKKKKSTRKKNTATPTKNKNTSAQTTNIRSSNRKLPFEKTVSLKIDELSWWEFEQLIYMYYKDLGYKPVRTKEGADGGIDLVYTNPDTYEKVAVQIKHQKDPVSAAVIRATDNAAKRNYGTYLSEIISSGTISNPALVEIDKYGGMRPKDRQWLNNKVVPWMNRKSEVLREKV